MNTRPYAYQGAYTLQSTDLDKDFKLVAVLCSHLVRGFSVGGTGTVECITREGGSVILSAVKENFYPVAVTQVRAQNTSATSITIYW